MPGKLGRKEKLVRSSSLSKIALPSGGSMSKAILRHLPQLRGLLDSTPATTDHDEGGGKNACSDVDDYAEHAKSLAISVQAYGILEKKSIRRNGPAKWSKRFCVVKESFMLYYADQDHKQFEKTGLLNSHPRGFASLGDCSIEASEEHNRPYCICITDNISSNTQIFAASSEEHQGYWLDALKDAQLVTRKNAKLGQEIINELESQGLRLHKEKQQFVDRLQSEAVALRDEVDKNEELEQIRIELQQEKRRLERISCELKNDLETIKSELQNAQKTKDSLEDEKRQLSSLNNNLQNNLQKLESEKHRILETLVTEESERKRLHQENSCLSETTHALKSQLMSIEMQARALDSEKTQIEEMLKENQQRATILESEKDYYSYHARELMMSLNDLAVEKALTEAELRNEVVARLATEKQLRAAEQALEHLELALRVGGAKMSAVLRDEIMPDVRKLKSYFEKCAEDAKMEADRPFIMRNAIQTRKSLLRRMKSKIRSSLRKSPHPARKEINGKINSEKPE